ncbi:ABC transporter ATP-binding protein [Vagococcus fluvialis]|uniref:ABC transporter ATP-binding protein n=1 Tax=Vagococcus fluvialis TaxID=2738 RepID=UPI00143316B3|nr:ABC transporter ATP-binding protein [Vagococcus fluvialis]MBO0488038.1 ABC transporter ATP-binding protein [Vagococcus fluvialis]MDT2781701.1 ABC transporter ATP-binding protein [Vagococcus fluvialis]NKC59989.1 ABC transporter ATP-binding protein [Vagococcus fluvialis]NKD50754.1 ABC transporter ATP-binding protein [Vagococcus fluvialis]UDM72179.1 ABC transporter ATP-binding protein/permease [Vagococcus fluvialis]
MEESKSAWSKSFTMKEQKTIIKRLLTFAKPFKKEFVLSLMFAVSLAVINIILPKILQIFMDDHLTAENTTMNIILYFAGLYAIGILFKAIVWFGQWVLYFKGSLKTYQSIRLELFKKLQTLGMRYFDQTPAGSIVSRVTNDTETLFEFWLVFIMVLSALFGVIASFVAMSLINLQLTLICLIFFPILGIIIWYYQKFSSKIYRGMREKLSNLNTKLNESISGMSIIQYFRQEERLEEEFEASNDDYLQSKYAMIKTNSLLLAPIINLLFALATALVIGFFGYDALSSPVDVGLIYAFISYVQQFFNPMTNMMDFLSIFQDGVVAGSRIIHILDHEELTPQQNPGANAEIKEAKIEFRNVSFSYDGKHNVLNNISFVANPGETVALVGHTGSGKSSIINVLMRFYEFYDGQILIDDVDIKDYPMKELREKMGLVLQDAFMFYGDIASNIRLLNKDITDEQIIEAAKFVQADKYINTLPNKYHAKVIEGGTSFSSGQRQLISFARTIVTDPKILVLDEATANIDTETENLIQEGLEKMRSGRTTIAIAHRLSTIKDANLILVLEKGNIVERGNHAQLIEHEGLYYDMYRLQNSQI